MQKATLMFPMRDDDILLGMKKRGFGVDKWNGFGGKVHNETIHEAATRELKEECGLHVEENDLLSLGEIIFVFENKPEWNQQVYIFTTKKHTGSPFETEEMRPQWFSKHKIPYDDMWDGDIHFLPYVLENKSITAKVYFSESGKCSRIVMEKPVQKIINIDA